LVLLYVLAQLTAEQKQVDSAEMMYQMSIDLSPYYKENYLYLGLLLSKTDDRYKHAFSYYKKAIEIDPNYVEAYFEQGNLYDDLEQIDSAEIMYRKVITLDEEFFDAFFNLGRLYFLQDRSADAEKQFLNTIQLAPDSLYVYINLGVLYAKMNQWHKTIKMMENTSLETSKKIEVFHGIGINTYDANLYEPTIEAFKKAIQLDKNDPWNYYLFCTIYIYLDEEDKAFKQLEKVLKKADIKGEDYYDQISQDEDLSGLRAHPKYKPLMKQYYPDRE